MRPSSWRCRPTAGPRCARFCLRLVDRGKAFLYRAGTVIMRCHLVLWLLTTFPMHNGQPPAIQDSVVATVGHAIEPVIRPLGFDWKIGVGLLTSFAAREVIIATLGTLHGVDPESHAYDLAGSAAPRTDARRSGRAAGLLRLRDAMYVDDCRGASRNQWLEVAGPAVHLHDAGRLRVSVRRVPHRSVVLDLPRRNQAFPATSERVRRSPPATQEQLYR